MYYLIEDLDEVRIKTTDPVIKNKLIYQLLRQVTKLQYSTFEDFDSLDAEKYLACIEADSKQAAEELRIEMMNRPPESQSDLGDDRISRSSSWGYV